MSSEVVGSEVARAEAVVLPRTAVPLGLTDPVERARAELKAALAAIEEKGNVPRRVSRASDRFAARARVFAAGPAGHRHRSGDRGRGGGGCDRLGDRPVLLALSRPLDAVAQADRHRRKAGSML